MEILIIIFLILINGVFSMSEIALVSSRKFKLEMAAKAGNANARKALEFANNPNTFLSTVQIGITLIGILTGIYSGEKITEDVKVAVSSVPFLADYANSLSVAIVLIILTFFSIVFGELIPKRIGLMFPEKIAMLVARPMTFVSLVTKPFIWLLTKTNNLFLGIFGLGNRKEGIVSEEEIKAMVQESAEGGGIQAIEHSIVHRVFALGDRKVDELMTHRNDLICVNIEDDIEGVRKASLKESHSAYPVYQDSSENLVGIVMLKELFPKDIVTNGPKISDFLKKPLMVHESSPAYRLLEQFRESKIHYAFVVDEYGDVQGMVCMDDILDALIGDVSELNQDEYSITAREEGTWLADGGYPFFEFMNYFEISHPEKTYQDFNTLAGLILDLFHHIPEVGEKVIWRGFEFEVIDMDGPRIDKILVKRL